MSPWASATPASDAISGISVSGMRSRLSAPKSPSMTFDERTNASVFS
jgi:hypothetical protein